LLLGLPMLQAQKLPDEFHTIQGETIQGRLLAADDKGNLRVRREGREGADEPGLLQLSALRTIRLGGRGRSNGVALGLVTLRTGLTLPATIESCDGGNVRLRSPLLTKPVLFPLRYVQAVRFAGPAKADAGFAGYAVKPKEDNDLIYIRTDAKILQRTVTIDRFADGEVHYEVRGRERQLPVTRLYGVVMSMGSGVRPDPQPRPRVDVILRAGQVVPGKLVAMDGEQCVVRLDEKVDVHLARDTVSVIQVLSDRLVYLTDLTPTKVEQTPAFNRRWKWQKNRSPLGPGIRLGGKRYSNGLVMIPRTRLTYPTRGHYDYLQATIGIEDRSTGPAHAIFRVLDGEKVLYESKPLTRQSDPVDLKVDIRKVDRLTIEADFGKNYDFGDHCVFAEARLIKQGS
jgi:hypothetical protein